MGSKLEYELKSEDSIFCMSNHLALLCSDHDQIPDLDTPCNRCHHLPQEAPFENWLCLSCKVVLCGRHTNKHMLNHFLETNHCLVLSYDTLLVWCYSCNSYLNIELISKLHSLYKIAYRKKFGKVPSFMIVDQDSKKEGLFEEAESKFEKDGKKQGYEGEKKSSTEDITNTSMPPKCITNEGTSIGSKRERNYSGKHCFCGEEAESRITLRSNCKSNKCDFLEECCFNNGGKDVEQDKVMNLVNNVAELKAEVCGLVSKFSKMESSSVQLMKMMVLMNMVYGFMLVVVIIVVVFKH